MGRTEDFQFGALSIPAAAGRAQPGSRFYRGLRGYSTEGLPWRARFRLGSLVPRAAGRSGRQRRSPGHLRPGPEPGVRLTRRGGSPLCTIDPRAAASRDARPRRLTRITSPVSLHIRERQRWGHWGGEELPAERTDGTTCPTHRRARRRTRPVTGRAQRSRRQTGVHLLARAIEIGSRRVQSQPCICRLQDGVLDRFGECEAIPQLRATVTSSWARKIGAQRVLSLARCTLVFV